jgi:hypothetical protein
VRPGLRVWVLLFALAAGCTPKHARQGHRQEGRYLTGRPGEGWAAVKPGGADQAWFHAGLGASLYTDSNCGPRFQEGRPEKLMQQLLAGLYGVEVIESGPHPVGGRTGELRVERGTLDGVPVQVGAVVINRGACTYDFVYIAPPARFSAGWEGFERVLAGFVPAGGDLD